jgi:hypothetical protein
MKPITDAAWAEVVRNAPPELRDKLRALGERAKAMKAMAQLLREGKVTLTPRPWGGKREGAGRPLGAKTRPDHIADKEARVRMRKLLAK